MLAATEGIILNSIKYGESSIISHIFTRDFGRHSYILNATRTKKSKNKAGSLQPLFLVDVEVYQKQSRDIQRIKSVKINQAYQSVPFDVRKSAQAIFLAEMLSKCIHEQESYPEMFDFIKNSLLYFDLMEAGISNFHLYFLFRLTEYLGFMPDTQITTFEGWFDMQKGKVATNEPSHPFFMNKDTTQGLSKMAVLKISELGQLKLTAKVRTSILSGLIDYYKLHIESFGELRSLKVLHEVFA
jgi:DNA repair protein RecO (recombination protein O)